MLINENDMNYRNIKLILIRNLDIGGFGEDVF